MKLRIDAHDLPGRSCGPSPDRPDGYHNIHVGVQRRNRPGDLLGLVPGDAPTATWILECDTVVSADGVDVRGPHIQGPGQGRFVYLSWGTVDDGTFRLFRRAKLWLDGVPGPVLAAAVESGLLVGSLGLTDRKGHPLCAAVRPPLIEWSAESSLPAGCAC